MNSVKIGDVATFQHVEKSKAQALKVVEEAAEVFSAWETYKTSAMLSSRGALLNECADVIQATCNLIAALGVEDFVPFMQRCKQRNRERGRTYGHA